MQPHGSDRVRVSGEKVVLHSRLAKAWTARTPKSGTHAEFPGTAVLWDDQYFEVIHAAPLAAGGVRYELVPWRDDHTIRVFSVYDEASEAALLADYEAAERQRKHSRLAAFSAMALGHLPERVQQRLANELGLFPARMTILSTIPSVVLLGVCVWIYVETKLRMIPSPIPIWLWFFAALMVVDSAVRFQTAMSQNRGVGSFPGTFLYGIYEMIVSKPDLNAKAPLTLVPEEDPERELLEALDMRGWMLTLLPAAEQVELQERLGYDYRKDAYSLAWALAALGAIGIIASVSNAGERVSALLSLIVAAAIVIEQALRIHAFKRGPAGSMFGVFVRPFVRDLLRK